MSDSSGSPASFHCCGTEFLLRDLELAITFMDMAEISTGSEHQERAYTHAVCAYRTVLRFLPRVTPSPMHRHTLTRKLAALESRMLAVGLTPQLLPQSI